MPKASKKTPKAESNERKIFSVRLKPSLTRRLAVFGSVTGQSNQEIAEAALEQYMRETKLTAEQAKELKAILGH